MKESTMWKGIAGLAVILVAVLVVYQTNPELFAVTPHSGSEEPSGHDCPAGSTWSDAYQTCVNVIPNYGEQATIDVACFDQEQETPGEHTVNMSVFEEGRAKPIKEKGLYDTSTTFTSTVGTTLDLYPIHTSSALYYGDPIIGHFVDSENEYIQCNIYNTSLAGSVNITAYENDGVTALTPGGATAQNFTLALGASQTEQFFIQLKNINKDNVYWFCAWAWNYTDNITDLEILSSGFSKEAMPQHLRAYSLDYIYSHDVIEFHEWDWQRFEFSVEAGSTDPITDQIYILPKDCAYYEKTDKSIGFGFADDTSSEADVGLTDAIATEPAIITIT